ncbi:MAG: cation diffusion facilitator family transporter [Ignavibacteriales bacterium]
MTNVGKTRESRDQLFAIKLSLAFGVFMLAIKWYAYLITDSAAIFSDAAESVVHIIGVSFAVYSLWLSLKPADKEHTYGHDKINYFSAGFEGGLIILAACYIIYLSIERLVQGVQLNNIDKGTYFTLGASVINLFLGLYLLRKGEKTNSLILVANGKHVLTDSWTSFGVVGGLILTWISGWLPFDPIFAIIVAVNILWTGGKLVKQSFGGLMDTGSHALREKIVNILDEISSDKKFEYHELRFRESGNVIWIEFHLLFPKAILLEEAHLLATDLEHSIISRFDKEVRITTHLEPVASHQKVHGEINIKK